MVSISVPLPQLLSHCAAVCPGRRYAYQLLSSLPPSLCPPRPAPSVDKSLLRDYRLVITDGHVTTTARDAIARAFAWEK